MSEVPLHAWEGSESCSSKRNPSHAFERGERETTGYEPFAFARETTGYEPFAFARETTGYEPFAFARERQHVTSPSRSRERHNRLRALRVRARWGTGARELLKRHFPRTRFTNLPDQWLQCQANGSNVCRVLRGRHTRPTDAAYPLPAFVEHIQSARSTGVPRS